MRASMRKALAALFELANGLVLVAVAFLGERVLLQSRSLVYAFLPLIGIAAIGLGVWRGRSSPLAAWQIVALLNLPMVLLIAYTAGHALRLLPMPVVGVAFAAMGVAMARGRAARGPGVREPAAYEPAAWRSRRVALPLLAAALLVLGAMGPPFARSLVASSEVREPAVPFQLAPAAGAPVASRQLRGRIAVIDFWATWCVPCQHELPELERLYQRFAGDPRVAFFAVDVAEGDTPADQGDTPARARDFLRQHGYHLPLAFDPEGRAAKALRAHGLPTLLVLDRSGRVRLRHVGFVGAEDLGAMLAGTIEQLLAEGPA
ncbi:MAG TPA: TlpA disulfide reductase family protein [Thermoanaerobaculia bacterium]|nr:TlpA disulfide reductase family protein [Thermoanaerobaculia bacterium]